MADAPLDGLLVVDKPSGWTSHDVVAKVRRLAGTRKVGHAGTLDPMATGVLVLGLGRATRLLGYISGADKAYSATVRLGQATDTDDAEGAVTTAASAHEVDRSSVEQAAAAFVGVIDQVPSSVSAIKVDGERAYAKARRGEAVELAARSVTVSSLVVGASQRAAPDTLDVEIEVVCSSGTYIRALARDLGRALGVGGHLTRLRRTRVGGFDLAQAVTLESLEGRSARHEGVCVIDLATAVAQTLPRRDVDDETARAVRHGRPVELAGEGGPTGVFGPTGEVLALMAPRDGQLRVVVGLTG